MFRDRKKKCMEDNHPAHKHICLFFTLKVNDVCWKAEWSTDDGLKAPIPDVRSIFGLVSFPHSIIPISLPNADCKAGLRATVAGHILPWCSSPAAAAAVAERSPPSTVAHFKRSFGYLSPHFYVTSKFTNEKEILYLLTQLNSWQHPREDLDATRLLKVMLTPPWHWDLQPWTKCICCFNDRPLRMQLMRDNAKRRNTWSKNQRGTTFQHYSSHSRHIIYCFLKHDTDTCFQHSHRFSTLT